MKRVHAGFLMEVFFVQDHDDVMWRMAELAEYLRQPYSTIKAEYKIWQLPFYKVGRSVLFRQSEIEQWLAERREA
jgi:excisionase family DNA binding protein